MSNERQATDLLIPFYLGEQTDLRGRKIQAIWAWDVEELECTHDYIQWLFPLDEQSRFNTDAPIVNEDILRSFQSDRQLLENLLTSLTVMLKFYGLQYINETKQIERSADYPIRKQEWVNNFDHNYLRITRILKCLMIFGLAAEARSFYQCLAEIYRENSNLIGAETFQYWTDAVREAS
jgi:Opioid growth factor receptor (OGFr) conserved region